MSLKLKIKKIKSASILEISGEVTGENISKITARLNRIGKIKTETIAIDLSGTTFIDSHGLGAFVYLWRVYEEQNRKLVFINPQGFIRNLFNGTNLDKIFKIVESSEEL